jgi:hypothetical protein
VVSRKAFKTLQEKPRAQRMEDMLRNPPGAADSQ